MIITSQLDSPTRAHACSAKDSTATPTALLRSDSIKESRITYRIGKISNQLPGPSVLQCIYCDFGPTRIALSLHETILKIPIQPTRQVISFLEGEVSDQLPEPPLQLPYLLHCAACHKPVSGSKHGTHGLEEGHTGEVVKECLGQGAGERRGGRAEIGSKGVRSEEG